MSQTELISRIRKLMSEKPFEGLTTEEIAKALDETGLVVQAALARMIGMGLVDSHRPSDDSAAVYFRTGAFVARQITPLIAGTPEWVVETFLGRLVCWCPSEFDAKVVADSLQRS